MECPIGRGCANVNAPRRLDPDVQGELKSGRGFRLQEGEKAIDLTELGLQRPRVFYYREPETTPFAVGRKEAATR
jgi:hypothetical protein